MCTKPETLQNVWCHDKTLQCDHTDLQRSTCVRDVCWLCLLTWGLSAGWVSFPSDCADPD